MQHSSVNRILTIHFICCTEMSKNICQILWCSNACYIFLFCFHLPSETECNSGTYYKVLLYNCLLLAAFGIETYFFLSLFMWVQIRKAEVASSLTSTTKVVKSQKILPNLRWRDTKSKGLLDWEPQINSEISKRTTEVKKNEFP